VTTKDESAGEPLESTWAKLRRRKVVQWGVVYAAGAWGLLQGLAYVSATFNWPLQLQQLATLALLTGLPIVLVMAWYHGDKGQQRVTAAELTIIALLFLLGGGIFWRYDRASSVAAPADASAQTPGSPSSAAPELSAVSARSIAVLPFVNMSGEPANEYFSDGISEEILNVLARVPELSVAARTSSFQFKGEKRDIEQIAAQLKVRMILEGSVRKQDDRVRITAQLIDAQTGYHLWSETYDRELKDIFAIQDEIAQAIGTELKVRVVGAGAGGSSVSGTKNLKAHDLYLRGLALWQVRRDDELWAAIDSFEQAIATDPSYAEAWGGLALCYAVIADYTVRISPAAAGARAREAAERALVLDPTLAESYAALGNVESNALNYETAVALFKRAIELKPSFATAHQWLGTTLMLTGEREKSLASLERAAALDPRSLIVASNYSSMLMIAGRNADAIVACEPVLAYAPESFLCVQSIGPAYLLDGKRDLARPYYDQWAKNWGTGTDRQVAALFDALSGRGDRQAFANKLAATPDRSWNDPRSGNLMSDWDIPILLMLLDQKELALKYIHGANRSTTLAWSIMMQVMDPIRCDARFKDKAAELKIRDLRAAELCT
jgi:TolB-like protein/tetratricopeptide (TPR) repeat protein